MAAGVMIGIDPHKRSHTAFVIDGREKQLGQLRVRASAQQSEQLLGWARQWRQRTWAIEGGSRAGIAVGAAATRRRRTRARRAT